MPRTAADHDNATSWYVNIESVDWQTPRPLAVGSRITFVARFRGRRIAYTYEIVEHVPQFGCGPGLLLAVLVRRLGAAHVAGVEPSEPFVASCRDAVPGLLVAVPGRH